MDDGTDRTSRIIRLGRQLDLARRDVVAKRALELWEYDVLAALRAAPPPFQLTPSALVAATLVTSGTITNRIDRLSRRGYVSREPDPSDLRGVLVRLTPSGRKKIDVVAGELSVAELAAWSSLGDEVGAQLDLAVGALLEGLEQ